MVAEALAIKLLHISPFIDRWLVLLHTVTVKRGLILKVAIIRKQLRLPLLPGQIKCILRLSNDASQNGNDLNRACIFYSTLGSKIAYLGK